jgi:hypothetical protein
MLHDESFEQKGCVLDRYGTCYSASQASGSWKLSVKTVTKLKLGNERVYLTKETLDSLTADR